MSLWVHFILSILERQCMSLWTFASGTFNIDSHAGLGWLLVNGANPVQALMLEGSSPVSKFTGVRQLQSKVLLFVLRIFVGSCFHNPCTKVTFNPFSHCKIAQENENRFIFSFDLVLLLVFSLIPQCCLGVAAQDSCWGDTCPSARTKRNGSVIYLHSCSLCYVMIGAGIGLGAYFNSICIHGARTSKKIVCQSLLPYSDLPTWIQWCH